MDSGKPAADGKVAAALAKPARSQRGPPFRFTKAGYLCRSGRMRMLALAASIRNFDPDPDYDLVIPLIPLRQEGSCSLP